MWQTFQQTVLEQTVLWHCPLQALFTMFRVLTHMQKHKLTHPTLFLAMTAMHSCWSFLGGIVQTVQKNVWLDIVWLTCQAKNHNRTDIDKCPHWWHALHTSACHSPFWCDRLGKGSCKPRPCDRLLYVHTPNMADNKTVLDWHLMDSTMWAFHCLCSQRSWMPGHQPQTNPSHVHVSYQPPWSRPASLVWLALSKCLGGWAPLPLQDCPANPFLMTDLPLWVWPPWMQLGMAASTSM